MSIHAITVTQIMNDFPDVPEEEFADEVKYIIDRCPGGDCTVWWECQRCDKDGHEPTEDETDEGEYEAHGELHRNIDGDWMTESKACAASATDSGSDAMQDVAQEAGIGTHQVDVTYWGDGLWEARLIAAPTLPVGATTTIHDQTPSTTAEARS